MTARARGNRDAGGRGRLLGSRPGLAAVAAGLAAAVTLGGAACEPEDRRPEGTTADPVETCRDVGEVCRIDDARLGVCQADAPGAAGGRCEGDDCFACTPQH